MTEWPKEAAIDKRGNPLFSEDGNLASAADVAQYKNMKVFNEDLKLHAGGVYDGRGKQVRGEPALNHDRSYSSGYGGGLSDDFIPDSVFNCLAYIIMAVTLGLVIFPFFTFFKGLGALLHGRLTRAFLFFFVSIAYVVTALLLIVFVIDHQRAYCRQIVAWGVPEEQMVTVDTPLDNKKIYLSVNNKAPELFYTSAGRNEFRLGENLHNVQLSQIVQTEQKYAGGPIQTYYENCNLSLIRNGVAVTKPSNNLFTSVMIYLKLSGEEIIEKSIEYGGLLSEIIKATIQQSINNSNYEFFVLNISSQKP